MKPDQTNGLWLRGNIYWLAATLSARGQVRVSLHTSDLAEAIQKAREIRAFPERHLDRTESSLLELFLSHQRKREISRARIDFSRMVLTELAGHARGGDLATLTTSQANGWWLAISARIKAKSAMDYLGVAKVFYKWAIDAHHATGSPVALIIPPKSRPTPRRVFLSPAEALRVLDECTDEDLKFALYCGLHCGLRRGEVIAARPRWFDLVAGAVHVQNEADWLTKDRDNRSIPLTTEFKSFLHVYGIRSPYMFRPNVISKSTNRTWRYRTDFAKAFDGHMERLGLGHVTFHDLRRTFASLHASAGTPLYHICKWLGDDPAVVERVYAHLIPNDRRINGPWEAARGDV